jgi:uncharacterized protein with NAD-binding domain and iron-sulfur cluster
MTPTGPRTRRRFLLDAASAGCGLAALGAGTPAQARVRARRTLGTVAVFGGGIAGLTAAHELAERGFDVTVYERRAWGGKARSTEVPGSARGGRKPLPGEHGWRVFFGFYRHTVDTMRRIPFGSNPNGVFDNLVPAPQFAFARDGGRRDLVLPLGAPDPRPYTPAQVLDLLVGVLTQTNLPPQAIARFASRLVVFLSSCDARRAGQWENTSWADYVDANSYGDDYRKILANPFTQFTQASKTEKTSAEFAGHFLEVVVYNELGLGSNGPLVRVLNAPTSEAFINPWLAVLRRLGVNLRLGVELKGLNLRKGHIDGAEVQSRHGTSTVKADYYVCALPVERARRLWSTSILHADPSLARMSELETAWMNGIKFFLRENNPIVRGHYACLDSPWAVEGLNQAQFWPADFARTYGDGRARDSLSMIIADWTTPGVLYDKAARECTPQQVAAETWEQLKRHVNKSGQAPKLTDDLVVSWNIDPGMLRRHARLISDDPLVLPAVGSYQNRPEPTTGIPNLLLAGDYLKGTWEVANMDAASQSARRAVNALLDQIGSNASRCLVTGTYRPPEWEPLKQIDEQRWKTGQPNLFDTTLTPVAELLNSSAARIPADALRDAQQLVNQLTARP